MRGLRRRGEPRPGWMVTKKTGISGRRERAYRATAIPSTYGSPDSVTRMSGTGSRDSRPFADRWGRASAGPLARGEDVAALLSDPAEHVEAREDADHLAVVGHDGQVVDALVRHERRGVPDLFALVHGEDHRRHQIP